MRVGQRLFLAVIPAILGVFTVAGLAYWGEYAHQAPRGLIIVAIIAAILSLVMAWYNTRYIARRVEGLAERTTGKQVLATQRQLLRELASAVTGGVLPHSGGPDELDTIESTVADLRDAVKRIRTEGEQRIKEAETRETEYTMLIDEVVRLIATRLEEAELPLHVLLSSPFGSLNENQEEMLTSAQAALDTADTEIRRLRTLLAVDRGVVPVVPHPVGLAELLKPTLAIVQARSRDAHVTVKENISKTAPRVIADAMQVQAALTALLTSIVAQTPAGSEIEIIAEEGTQNRIRIVVHHAGTSAGQGDHSLDLRLARRLILLQHGTLEQNDQQTIIELPSEVPVHVA